MTLTPIQIDTLIEQFEQISRMTDALTAGDVDPIEVADDIRSIAEEWIKILEEE